MRLTILHTTTYSFKRSVQFNPHRLMLRPRGDQDLQVLDYGLSCSLPARLVESQDVLGNLVTTALFDEPAQKLEITSRLVLRASAAAWPVFRIEPHAHAYPFLYSDDERTDLGAFLLPEQASSPVGAWARSFIHSRPTDTLALLKDLNAGVLTAAAYRSRDEEGTQTAADTLSLASGSCRDLAALFIEAARCLGFGARAASGYLVDLDDSSLSSDTTHAWAEVYLPAAGWIAFDPTHRRVGGRGLITVAIGRNNASVLPVTGSYVGAAGDFLGMTVRVEATSAARP